MAIQFQQLGPNDSDLLASELARWQPALGMGRTELRRRAERVLTDPAQWHAWLLRRQGAPIGYLLLQFRNGSLFDHPRAQVAGLYVEPASRSAVVAQVAHRFAAEIARWLHVRLVHDEAPRLDRHALLFAAGASAPRWLASTPTQSVA